MFLLAGNHEDANINCRYGFQEECETRFGEEDGRALFRQINNMFVNTLMEGPINYSVFLFGYSMGVFGSLMGVLGYVMGVIGYLMAWRRRQTNSNQYK